MHEAGTTGDLFASAVREAAAAERLADGAWVLRAFVRDDAAVLAAIERVMAEAAPRRMTTPGGRRMSVEMTNCGRAGWISEPTGYRYSATDPESGRAWPAMPRELKALAAAAAGRAGYAGFVPDVCLVNRYAPGTQLSLHRDVDERDFTAPIVSVSLGLPATFLFGGARRADRPQRVPLEHGDVVVWGGPTRRYYHGVARLADGEHALLGACRINLTFRKAL